MKSFLVMKGVYDGNMSEYHAYVTNLNGGDKTKEHALEMQQKFEHEQMLLELEASGEPQLHNFEVHRELFERKQERLIEEQKEVDRLAQEHFSFIVKGDERVLASKLGFVYPEDEEECKNGGKKSTLMQSAYLCKANSESSEQEVTKEDYALKNKDDAFNCRKQSVQRRVCTCP